MPRTPEHLLSGPEEAALLKEVAEALNEANDISAAMGAILPRLSQVLGLTTAWAFRFDPRRATFVEMGASGLPPALAARDGEALKSSWCECQDRLVTGRLDTAVNIVRCSRLRAAKGSRQGLKFHASIPLRMNDQPLGILNVAASGAQVFTPPALNLLRVIGYQVAVTMDRAALLSDMRRHNERLGKMTSIARELTGIMDEAVLLRRAIRLFSDRLGYEGTAVLRDSKRLDAVENLVLANEPEYSYQDRVSAPLAEDQRHILTEARSYMESPIASSPYVLRIESRAPRAFTSTDKELLTAFTWYLSALLEQIDLYRQALEAARWHERRMVAADLHDSVSQHLFSAQLLTRALKAHWGCETDTTVQEIGERLTAVIGQSQREMRDLVQTLRSDHEGLADEVRRRLWRLKALPGVTIIENIQEVSCRLTPRLNDAVLHILDEALQNGLKHAYGAPITVCLQRRSDDVHLEVLDSGPGFPVDRMPSGHGLDTMRERAISHGLALTIEGKAEVGTKISLIIPCPKEVST